MSEEQSDYCESHEARNLSVKTSLSAAEIVSLIHVVIRCKGGPTNESKCSKRWGVIRTKRKKYSLPKRRKSFVNM